MKKRYKCAGGTVVREGEKDWKVFAPDNRLVGKFRTRKQALAKAQHWDKWDAFASLQSMCLGISPFTTMLLLSSFLGKEFKVPTEKDMVNSLILDLAYIVLQKAKAEGKINDKKMQEVLGEVVGKLFDSADESVVNRVQEDRK